MEPIEIAGPLTNSTAAASLPRHLQGIRLVLWAEILCVVFMNLWGFFVPIVGGAAGLSSQAIYYLWTASQILPPIAAVVAAVGVFRLTNVTDHWVGRVGIKAGTVIEVIFRFQIAGNLLRFETGYAPVYWFSHKLVLAVLASGVFFLCAARLQACGDTIRPRRIRVAGLAVAVWEVLSALATVYVLEKAVAHLSTLNILLWISGGLITAWAFCALRATSQALAFVLNGRCIKCGYRLDHLSTSRCPECGTTFDVLPTTTKP